MVFWSGEHAPKHHLQGKPSIMVHFCGKYWKVLVKTKNIRAYNIGSYTQAWKFGWLHSHGGYELKVVSVGVGECGDPAIADLVGVADDGGAGGFDALKFFF